MWQRYETSLSLLAKSDKVDDARGRRKPRKVYSVEGEEAKEDSSFHRQVADLQKMLAQAMERLEELTVAEHNRAAAASKATTSTSGSCSDTSRESTALPLE